MNIMYLSLYGVAAVVLVVVFIRTCLERDKMTRIVCLTEMLALICVVTYSVNFITDNYMAMSVATSIMMAAQDAATNEPDATYPATEADLIKAVAKTWTFPETSDYISLELNEEKYYSLLTKTKIATRSKEANGIYII